MKRFPTEIKSSFWVNVLYKNKFEWINFMIFVPNFGAGFISGIESWKSHYERLRKTTRDKRFPLFQTFLKKTCFGQNYHFCGSILAFQGHFG